MVLLGWSQRDVFSQRLYDHVQFSGKTNLTHVMIDGVRYVGTVIKEVDGRLTKKAFKRATSLVEEGKFGILCDVEPKMFVLEDVVTYSDFESWFEEVNNVALDHDQVVLDDKEDFRESYDLGDTPKKAFEKWQNWEL